MGTEYYNFKVAGDNNDYSNNFTVNSDNTVTWSSTPPTGNAYLSSFISQWNIEYYTDTNGVPTGSSVTTPVWSSSSGFWLISESKGVMGYGSGTVGDLDNDLHPDFGFEADSNDIYFWHSGTKDTVINWVSQWASGSSSSVIGSGTAGYIPKWSNSSTLTDSSLTETQLSSHLSDSTIHFTVSSIDHGSISGLGDDDHPQYPNIADNETITGTWTFNTITINNQGTGGNPSIFSNSSAQVLDVQGILRVRDKIVFMGNTSVLGNLTHNNTSERTYTFPDISGNILLDTVDATVTGNWAFDNYTVFSDSISVGSGSSESYIIIGTNAQLMSKNSDWLHVKTIGDTDYLGVACKKLWVTTYNHETSAVSKILVDSTTNSEVRYRTPAEILSDIGAAGKANNETISGTWTFNKTSSVDAIVLDNTTTGADAYSPRLTLKGNAYTGTGDNTVLTWMRTRAQETEDGSAGFGLEIYAENYTTSYLQKLIEFSARGNNPRITLMNSGSTELLHIYGDGTNKVYFNLYNASQNTEFYFTNSSGYKADIVLDGKVNLNNSNLEDFGTLYWDDQPSRWLMRCSSDGTSEGTLFNLGIYWNDDTNYLYFKGYGGTVIGVQSTDVITCTTSSTTISTDATINGSLSVTGTISEGGTSLSSKYLSISAQAADSDKLDGYDSSDFCFKDTQSKVITGGPKWVRIASGTSRATANFTVYSTTSGMHDEMKFRVGVSYPDTSTSRKMAITVIERHSYGTPVITKIRFVRDGTYDTYYIEVYINTSNDFNLFTKMEDNDNPSYNSSWSLMIPVDGSVPSGYSAQEFDLSTNTHFLVGNNTGTILNVKSSGVDVTGTLNVSSDISEAGATLSSKYARKSSGENISGAWTFSNTLTTNSIVPAADSTYDLGESGNAWSSIWADTIYEGGTALSSKYLSTSSLNAYLAIGSSNQRWTPCIFEGGNKSVTVAYGNVTNDDTGIPFSLTWAIPLPVDMGGKTLYVSGIRFYVADADSNNYVETTKLRAIKTDGNASNLYTYTTDLNTIGMKTITFSAIAISSSSDYFHAYVILDISTDTSSSLKIRGMQVRYYYA